MKKYTCIEVRPNWLGSAKSLTESVEHALNEKTAEGFQLVDIGYIKDNEGFTCAILTFTN